MGSFEILEHTADVGIRGRGATIEEAFEQATLGLLEITGARRPGTGAMQAIEVTADDHDALLVNWLEEVLYLQDARDAVVGDVTVDAVEEGRARGAISLAPRGDLPLEGTAVKAITYHQLAVERAGDEWIAQAFVDV